MANNQLMWSKMWMMQMMMSGLHPQSYPYRPVDPMLYSMFYSQAFGEPRASMGLMNSAYNNI